MALKRGRGRHRLDTPEDPHITAAFVLEVVDEGCNASGGTASSYSGPNRLTVARLGGKPGKREGLRAKGLRAAPTPLAASKQANKKSVRGFHSQGTKKTGLQDRASGPCHARFVWMLTCLLRSKAAFGGTSLHRWLPTCCGRMGRCSWACSCSCS